MLDDMHHDNFAKVDTVVRNALYDNYYKDRKLEENLKFEILRDNKKIGENYGEYINIIDAIRKSSEDPVSRNGLDHLLWYSNKGYGDNDDNN